MSNVPNGGGHAFPTDYAETYGMSRLDYFAAAALTGLLSKYGYSNNDDGLDPRLVEKAYGYAKRMIEISKDLNP